MTLPLLAGYSITWPLLLQKITRIDPCTRFFSASDYDPLLSFHMLYDAVECPYYLRYKSRVGTYTLQWHHLCFCDTVFMMQLMIHSKILLVDPSRHIHRQNCLLQVLLCLNVADPIWFCTHKNSAPIINKLTLADIASAIGKGNKNWKGSLFQLSAVRQYASTKTEALVEILLYNITVLYYCIHKSFPP